MKDLENPKTKRIYLRVSEKDYNTIKHNSRHFMRDNDDRAMSFYIRQALIEFSNRSVLDRWDMAKEVLSFCRGCEHDIERLSENISKVSNRLLYMGMSSEDTEETNPIVANAISECMPTFTQCLKSIDELRKNLRTAMNKVRNLERDYPTEIRPIEPK